MVVTLAANSNWFEVRVLASIELRFGLQNGIAFVVSVVIPFGLALILMMLRLSIVRYVVRAVFKHFAFSISICTFVRAVGLCAFLVCVCSCSALVVAV